MNKDSAGKKDSAALILLISRTPTVVLKLLHPPREGITLVFTIALNKANSYTQNQKQWAAGVGVEGHKSLMQFLFLSKFKVLIFK